MNLRLSKNKKMITFCRIHASYHSEFPGMQSWEFPHQEEAPHWSKWWGSHLPARWWPPRVAAPDAGDITNTWFRTATKLSARTLQETESRPIPNSPHYGIVKCSKLRGVTAIISGSQNYPCVRLNLYAFQDIDLVPSTGTQYWTGMKAGALS